MSDCREGRRLIAGYQTGDLDADGLVKLEDHCRDCADCRSLLRAHDALLDLGDAAPLPADRDFARMRDGVMARLDRPAGTKGTGSLWTDLRAFLGAHPVAAAPAVVLALVAAVFFGRWTAAPGDPGDALMSELARQASLRQGVHEYLDNPLTYTNVSVRPRGDRLALSFDVQRHVDLEADLDSPLARDVLLATIVDGPGLGSRLRAMQLAPAIPDAGLREALAFILRNDPDVAVRLGALDALAHHADLPRIREALLHTLGADPSVQARLQALEHLAGRQIDPDIIRSAITTQNLDGDAALLQRAVQLQRRES